jgi:hypothetical protein
MEAFPVGPLLAVTERIRQRSRAAGEVADSEMGVAGAGAPVIGRKRAEKIVKHQGEAGAMDGGLKTPFVDTI